MRETVKVIYITVNYKIIASCNRRVPASDFRHNERESDGNGFLQRATMLDGGGGDGDGDEAGD